MNFHEIAVSEACEAGRYDAFDNVVLAEQHWRTVETAAGIPVPKQYWDIRKEEEKKSRFEYDL